MKMTFGKRVKIKRAELGMSQKSLASNCGISVNFLSQIENDRKQPSFKTFQAINDELGLEVEPRHTSEIGSAELEVRKFLAKHDVGLVLRELTKMVSDIEGEA